MEGSEVNTKSWVQYTVDNHFPIENIPFSSMKRGDNVVSVTRVGDLVIDLSYLESEGIFADNGPLFKALKDAGKTVFDKQFINDFVELGKDHWHEARVTL